MYPSFQALYRALGKKKWSMRDKMTEKERKQLSITPKAESLDRNAISGQRAAQQEA